MKQNFKRKQLSLDGTSSEKISEGQEEKGSEDSSDSSDTQSFECQDRPKDNTTSEEISILPGTTLTIEETNTDEDKKGTGKTRSTPENPLFQIRKKTTDVTVVNTSQSTDLESVFNRKFYDYVPWKTASSQLSAPSTSGSTSLDSPWLEEDFKKSLVAFDCDSGVPPWSIQSSAVNIQLSESKRPNEDATKVVLVQSDLRSGKKQKLQREPEPQTVDKTATISNTSESFSKACDLITLKERGEPLYHSYPVIGDLNLTVSESTPLHQPVQREGTAQRQKKVQVDPDGATLSSADFFLDNLSEYHTKDDQGQEQLSLFPGGSSMNCFHHRRQDKRDKVTVLERTPPEMMFRSKKESCFRTAILKTFKQTENSAADKERFKRPEVLKNFSLPHSFTPATQQQPLTTGSSSEEEEISSLLQSSFEEFTPYFHGDEGDETYWFQCSGPGLYQCSVSGLVFDMKGGGDVFYRVVPWNRRSLSQRGKKPAGPLFDISCQQRSVAQLHLPHCEVRSTGGCRFLSVAHVHDEGIELIRPERITETHVIISITGFSAFGNVKDEDSPPAPVQALVLLFYKPPADPESEYEINVLMLPKNVVFGDVLHFRKKLDQYEIFLKTNPDCNLQPNQLYSLSTSPGEDDLVLVDPTEAEFDAESYNNYFSKFQVVYEKTIKRIRLFLRDSSSSTVWERRVCLSTAGVRRSCGPTQQNLSPNEQLMEIRTSFKDRVSGPVLQSLLDKLLEKKVLSDSEREAVEGEKIRGDKARRLVDMVRRKGDAASSQMIHFLCDLDPFLSEYLGLM